MHKTTIDGVHLGFETRGSGEPVLLIGTGPIADSFLPLFTDSSLAERHLLVRYRQRGQNGGRPAPDPVSFSRHAADAAALLEQLNIRRAHVVGHSTGASIALQLASDYPDVVQTLTLMEPPLPAVPSAADFFGRAEPAVAAFAAGDRETALVRFLTVATSLSWERCRDLLDRHVPGSVADAVLHADTFFGSYLPAIADWQFGAEDAARIPQPVLSVVGTESDPFFIDADELLRQWFPQLERCVVPDVAHLLHLQQVQPVVRGVGAFLARHPMSRA